MSKVGGLTLIEINLEALPSYVCSSSLLPPDIAKFIDNIHRQFFGANKKTKMNSINSLDKVLSAKK